MNVKIVQTSRQWEENFGQNSKFSVLGAVFPHFYLDKREIWLGGAVRSPVPNFTFIGTTCRPRLNLVPRQEACVKAIRDIDPEENAASVAGRLATVAMDSSIVQRGDRLSWLQTDRQAVDQLDRQHLVLTDWWHGSTPKNSWNATEIWTLSRRLRQYGWLIMLNSGKLVQLKRTLENC